MKRKLIAILAAVTLLCSVFVGMTFSASAEGERGFGMSKSEWKDFFGQVKEYDDGIGIGADASLKSPLYGESISLSMQFSVLPANGWFVLSFAGISNFNGWQAVDPNGSGLPVTGCFYIMLQPGEETISVNIAHWKDIDGTMTKEDIAEKSRRVYRGYFSVRRKSADHLYAGGEILRIQQRNQPATR